MYIGQNVRQKVDAQIEALAQAINKSHVSTSVEYSRENITSYALAKLLSRLIGMQGGLNQSNIVDTLGLLETVQQEFARRVATGYSEKQRNINGDVFGEIL